MKEVFYSLGVTASTLAERAHASKLDDSDVSELAEANAHLGLWHLQGLGTPYDFSMAEESFMASAAAVGSSRSEALEISSPVKSVTIV